ncbi:hypothetical protein ACOI22_07270 [Glaciecola sp. 2405UD65-10]|uniref:hypothetical protein n=1 Tax=Glaciecola sp. 2405UD65-10 TaxID=3397244 RepID=UPI003B5985F1
MFRCIYLLGSTAIFGSLASTGALANNGGVHGPNVKAGASSAEFRLNTTESNGARDDRQQYRIHYQQSMNDRLQVRFVLQYRDFGNFEYDNAKAEFLYNYKKAGSGNYSAGLRLDVRTSKGERPEDVVVNWVNQYNISSTLHVRALAIVGKNVTSNGNGDKPSSLGSRFALTKKMPDGIQLSAEIYNTYGEIDNISGFEDQRHQFGPSIRYNHNDWYIYGRYLVGLTSATEDHNFQFRVGTRF